MWLVGNVTWRVLDMSCTLKLLQQNRVDTRRVLWYSMLSSVMRLRAPHVVTASCTCTFSGEVLCRASTLYCRSFLQLQQQ